MTGFKLTWNIQNEHPSKKAPFEQNEDLMRMIYLATTKRVLEMSRDEIIDEAVEKKADILKSEGLDYTRCEFERDDTIFEHFADQLDQVLFSEQPNKTRNVIQEDIETGLVLYLIGMQCPKETMKIAQFVLQIAKEESLPSFILVLINTLQAEQLALSHKKSLGRIYKVLDDIFGFHLGKILLATSTPDQLSAFQNQEFSFFNSSDQHVQKCISGQSCDDVFALIQGIGGCRSYNVQH